MQSIRSRIIISLLRNRHLFKLKLKPEVVDESFSVTKFRDEIDKLSAKVKLPKDVSSKRFLIDDIDAEWIIPQNSLKNKVILYIHGGGFITGSIKTHRMHVAKFAKESKVKSLLFNYRLAPEHVFPAAIDDCVKVYKWLLENGFNEDDIVIGGESAGGTLSLSLLLTLKKEKIKLPKAAFSISPVTDLRCEAASFEYNAKKDIAPMNSWNIWTQHYIGATNPKTPLLSPLFGNYEGMPPIYICVGSHEIHLDDCKNMAKVIQEYGVETTLKVWPKMIHAFPILSPFFPEAKQALSEICEFINEQL